VTALQSEISTNNHLRMAADDTHAGPSKLIQSLEIDNLAVLSEDLETAAQRVRSRLRNMAADIIEIGCELRRVKQRLEHGHFLEWMFRTFFRPSLEMRLSFISFRLQPA
jgi:hypothetical protein